MTSLITQPQLLAMAAADASAIGSALNEAKAAAAGPTTSVAAAAEDEVSAITAAFFGGFGQEYQALLQQATAFHDGFVAALAAAGNAYAQAEGEIAGTLGLTGGASSSSAVTAVSNATTSDPAVSQILFIGATGMPNPTPSYINAAFTLFMDNPNNMYTAGPGALTPFFNAVTTAQGAYIFTGTKDLTYNISLARGVTSLETQIAQSFAAGGTSLGVFGYSQGAQVASLAMPQLATTYTPSELSFTLIGDPLAPNGGFFSRFPGLNLPSVGVTFGGGTPSDLFPTTIYTREYDGFADFPQYPINVLSDANAMLGILYVHGGYLSLTPSQVATGFLLPGSEALGTPDSMTNYYMIPTANLPLLDPIRAIPVIGNPIADLLQPDLTYLVNWGYGNPAYGYSTGPANVITPFGFLPPLSDTLALGPDLISGTQAGVSAFASDISAMVPTSLPAVSVPNLSLSSLTGALTGASGGMGTLALPTVQSIPETLTNFIQGIETANYNFSGSLANITSTAYGTLLPTADLGTALAISLPSYDVNLFLNGITEAINGDPVGGLVNAFGDPIAANVGLTTAVAFFELSAVENSLDTILTGTPNPGID
ncbi:MAG TPA: PE-PPE domain-containing protein [Mycobacterium sp.]|nr:PE-PPE domain-containing protein [Mycobacterium sp.]HUH71299.1 PE-PPE domain-containing protein [Mycobacterium sp.]